jgi:hypothetical protein
VRPERFELPAFWFVARRSIQLSYGRTVDFQSITAVLNAQPPPGRCWTVRSAQNLPARQRQVYQSCTGIEKKGRENLEKKHAWKIVAKAIWWIGKAPSFAYQLPDCANATDREVFLSANKRHPGESPGSNYSGYCKDGLAKLHRNAGGSVRGESCYACFE